MSYSEGLELTLNTRDPWKPVIQGVPGIFECNTIGLCYIEVRWIFMYIIYIYELGVYQMIQVYI